ncbi:MAG: KpsF/GutQ family sugar-phosphate isomerase [Alphaproteobacteria bacterium]|nr:KpsF/GutQ family sugar-phosphate isomerase [Alphaproteobacteria bacterium]
MSSSKAKPPSFDAAAAIAAGREVALAEARALDALAAAIEGPMAAAFVQAAETLQAARGKAIITGMGKSGHIARKIAATLASTGRPAMFVHPGEASHGDLGMITPDDCVLAISRGGESHELTDLVHHCRRLHIPLIAMTFRADSTLAKDSDVVLALPDLGEADDNAPAPTTSTTMCLALGDALAIALLRAAGFTTKDFRAIHPGGRLGAMLKHVRDVMRTGEALPLIAPNLPVQAMLGKVSEGGIGCVGVVENDRLIGVITDGDIRRKLDAAAFSKDARALMTANPKTISPDAPLADAVATMNEKRITALFAVVDGAPVGVVHMHDLLSAGVR